MNTPRRSRRRVVRALGVLATAATVGASVAACSEPADQVPSLGFAIDNVVTTYNANTVEGAATGAVAALGRVLTGMNYVGPSGAPVADTDFGTASVLPGDALTVQYRLNPASVYSDGVPVSCDDLVLAWAAGSGRFTRPGEGGPEPMFDATSRAGYADIDRIDCQPGSKDALVVFKRGRSYLDWRSLFGATELMPAHVAGQAAGVPDVVGAIGSGDADAVGRIADFWNTGWALAPGDLDTAKFPSSGPYKIDSYTEDGGLVLVENDRWWGNKPATSRIVVWPKGSDVQSQLADGDVEVVDIGSGSMAGLDLGGFEVVDEPSRSVEQLVLGTRGVFASADARRAFALCLPRQALYDQLGHPGFDRTDGLGSGVVDSRITAPDTLFHPSAVAAEGGIYTDPDIPGAKAAREDAGESSMTVRVGYLAPDDRRARTVREIAASCEAAGITVEDAGSPDFRPGALGAGDVDAVLAGTAAAAGAAGSSVPTDASFALRSGNGDNAGGFSNRRYDEIVDQLAVDGSLAGRMSLSGEAEAILWDEMPSVPLFDQPRTTAHSSGMHGVVPNPTRSGAGWNMDRWILLR
ncbi:ABC transporter substrate-binding protein [Rhodococcus sp. SGAir0479]|uniref:ABC transporter substrate-binding protein n=1 Tax=Rhodococcus sp. SGAir0479 TaxID=2567884 RepID=UPI0010CD1685|nr:ABC transporter substrate-binding protein [Rhodococcus sp. SGAir0479]QCQ90891.1 peptide-binding protein [Rhodococcus sp. SGAir0479]